MKKIPCVFERDFDFTDPRNPVLLPRVTPGCEWVLAGEGVATVKFDGTAVMVRENQVFKRYDAKRGKAPPRGFEAAQEPDAITGHWPGWAPIDVHNPEPGDVWIALAYHCTSCKGLADATYEACGPRINSNHQGLSSYRLIRHGDYPVFAAPRTFEGLREFLGRNETKEGLVFWRREHDGAGDMAKIRRVDFGFPWPAHK